MKNIKTRFKNASLGLIAILLAMGLVCCKSFDFKYAELPRLPASSESAVEMIVTNNVTPVAVFFGDNINANVKSRIQQLFNAGIKNISYAKGCVPNSSAGQVEFHFGNTSSSTSLISAEEKSHLSPEGFIIKTQRTANCLKVVVDSRGSDAKAQRGLSYGSYALLQDIGFRFLHPLMPTVDHLNLEFDKINIVSRTENPRWESRAIHLHTMHPLELTNLLNGWGVKGPQDQTGWLEMLPYWTSYMEWLIAHKQNEVEWMLLWDPSVGAFNQSILRQKRLSALNVVAHNWGIATGIVTPLRFVQQNGWTLLRNQKMREGQPNEKQENLKEIKSNLDWLLATGFSYIGGEMGEGEFSSAPPAASVEELNGIADYLSSKGIPYRVKVHISTKQYAAGFKDPGTGKDINFNYLPLFANSHVGVEPHTVQIYSLDDPAPTYGNKNFLDMFRFIKMAAAGTVGGRKREVLFYPESAYWVSYDNDVPLFLPVYPYRRVQDLRLIAHDEDAGEMKRSNSHINGQVIFASGWEWGYWFNDMIGAEASWNPHVEAVNSLEAYRKIVADTLRLPLNSDFITKLVKLTDDQERLLVLGKLQGKKAPMDTTQRSGIAYLSGVDVWDEIGMIVHHPLVSMIPGADKIPLTQPAKYPVDFAFGITGDIARYLFPDLSKIIPPIFPPNLTNNIPRDFQLPLTEDKYTAEIKPLLAEMSSTFMSDWQGMASVSSENLPDGLKFFAKEFSQGAEITFLRAQFVAKLYEARYAVNRHLPPNLIELKSIINKARAIAAARLAQVPMKENHKALISRWDSPESHNPTDYHFGYLWSAYNMFYWQREFNKIAGFNTRHSICYMNITKVSDLEGKPGSIVSTLENISKYFGSTEGCGTLPASEPNLNTGW